MSVDSTARVPAPRLGDRGRALLLVAGIVLLAFNLRPALSSVGPVLEEVRDGLGLTGATAAALVTVPVLCFGLLAPAAPVLARRIGVERTLTVAAALLAAGLLVRVGAGTVALFAGTILCGTAIAVTNVLLPALVKRDFPRRVGLMTGIYTTVLTVAATLAAGVTVPLAVAFGDSWRAALGFWAVPALVAAIAWLPALFRRRPSRSAVPGLSAGGVRALLRSALAWQLTLFFGLQSLGFYAVISWLPSIYRDEGFSPATAGALLAVAMIGGAPVGLVVPGFAARARDQRAYVAAANLAVIAGLSGVLLAPSAAPWVWAVLIGLGQATLLPLGLTMVALRSRTPPETARLSALVQGVGYLIAATGPLVVGALHELSGSWKPALGLLVALQFPQLAFGVAAGRARFVSPPPR